MRGKKVVVNRGAMDKVAVELRDEAHLNELVATHGAANVLDADTNEAMQKPVAPDVQPEPAQAPTAPKKKAKKKPAKKAAKKPAKKARK